MSRSRAYAETEAVKTRRPACKFPKKWAERTMLNFKCSFCSGVSFGLDGDKP